MIVLTLFIILQITDGLFTFHGVRAMSIDTYEGNLMLAYFMHRFGIVNTILVVKLIAILSGYYLYRLKFIGTLFVLTLIYSVNFIWQIVNFQYTTGQLLAGF